MIGVRYSQKTESMLLKALTMSFAVHCIAAAFLIICSKAKTVLTLPPTIITVEIRTFEVEKREKPQAAPLPALRPELAPKPVAQNRSVQVPIQNSIPFQRPEQAFSPSPARKTEDPQITPPVPAATVSTAKSHQPAAGTVYPTGREKIAAQVKGELSGFAESPGLHVYPAYLAALKELIERHKEYPTMARKGGMEGTVRISCILSRKGELREATVVKSSGCAILDNAALRAVRSVGQYPLVPPEIKGDKFGFTAPISFRLTAE